MAVKVSDSYRGHGENRKAPITAKQVALILARAREAGLKGEEALLEWLEYSANLGQFFRIEDLPQYKFQQALDGLAEKGNS